jgi:hypothetical protein
LPVRQTRVTIIVLLPEDFQDFLSWLDDLTACIHCSRVDIHLLCRTPPSGLEKDSLPEELINELTSHDIPGEVSDAAALNRGAESAAGDYLVFLRGGLVPQKRTWIETFLGYCQAENCGVVGGMLPGGDGQIDNPALPDLTDMSCRMYRSFLVDGSSHFNGIACPQNVIAASFDFCMVRNSLFQKAGGFDAESFPEKLYDIDLCLRLRNEGVEHVVTPFCTAVLHSSSDEGGDIAACGAEREIFQKRWHEILIFHPYYNEQRLLTKQGVSIDDWHHWIAGIGKDYKVNE